MAGAGYFCQAREVLVPQPNKTKLPLQVLAVTKGNGEKIKVWDRVAQEVLWEI
jgi:hypothetical protein